MAMLTLILKMGSGSDVFLWTGLNFGAAILQKTITGHTDAIAKCIKFCY